jgi:hypothetical protein
VRDDSGPGEPASARSATTSEAPSTMQADAAPDLSKFQNSIFFGKFTSARRSGLDLTANLCDSSRHRCDVNTRNQLGILHPALRH